MNPNPEISPLTATVLKIGGYAPEGILVSRERGEQIGAAIREGLHQLPLKALLIVDCGEIQSATNAALCAAFTTARVTFYPNRYLLLKIDNARSEFCEAVEHLAREYAMTFPATDAADDWRVFGKLTITETQTLEMVRSQPNKEPITAALLAERWDIRTSAASNRLKHLFDQRLIRREERLRPGGGREFVYTSLTPYIVDSHNEGVRKTD